MKILNAPEYAEVILHGRRIHFTDAVELKENGCIVELKRVGKPSIETEAVELNIKEDKVKVGKHEFILNSNDHIAFTIKDIKVDVHKL